MKILGYILTAAAILIGADVFIAASDGPTGASTAIEQPPLSLAGGGTGAPPPPPPDGE